MVRQRRKAPRETVKISLSPEKHENCIRAGWSLMNSLYSKQMTSHGWCTNPHPVDLCIDPLIASYSYTHYHPQAWLCFDSLQTQFYQLFLLRQNIVWNHINSALAVSVFIMFCLFVLLVMGFSALPAHKDTIMIFWKIPSTQTLCSHHLDYTDLYLSKVCHK